ncbi:MULTISPECIES: universal stress protein [Emticicia]|uniref:universal stress protein n=1 Tax=Emticicia TaxID=312278 RepID=UPI0007D89AC4|nr:MULTISPECIES: universal stress protein [Emticicia]
MTTKILIPTDFHVESLNTLKLAINHLETYEVDVVLMYAQDLGNSITDLLFYNPKKLVESLRTKEFDEALSILKNRFETRIKSISYEIFHGYRVKLMEDFIESKKIDSIFLPKSYHLQMSKNGFDTIPLIKKSKLTYKELDWETGAYDSEELQLNALFIY